MPLMKALPPLNLRWMIELDLDRIIEIEAACFDVPWTKKQLMRLLRDRTIIGHVAEDRRERIHGFFVWQLQNEQLELINFAVDPASRRRGVGTLMLAKFHSKVCGSDKPCGSAVVRERNMPMHMLLRSCGWRATTVLRDFYGDSDGYHFQYVPTEAERDFVRRLVSRG